MEDPHHPARPPLRGTYGITHEELDDLNDVSSPPPAPTRPTGPTPACREGQPTGMARLTPRASVAPRSAPACARRPRWPRRELRPGSQRSRGPYRRAAHSPSRRSPLRPRPARKCRFFPGRNPTYARDFRVHVRRPDRSRGAGASPAPSPLPHVPLRDPGAFAAGPFPGTRRRLTRNADGDNSQFPGNCAPQGPRDRRPGDSSRGPQAPPLTYPPPPSPPFARLFNPPFRFISGSFTSRRFPPAFLPLPLP